jgi:predicted small metal-binding protein
MGGPVSKALGRKYIDCRDFPGKIKCSVSIAADSEEELLEAVVQHGATVHGYENTPEFREQIRKEFKEGNPPR